LWVKIFLILNFALLTFLPTGFHHAGNFTGKRQLPEADTAQPKIPHKTSGPPTPIASIVLTHAKFRFSLGFFNQTLLGQMISLNSEFKFISLKRQHLLFLK